MKTSLISTALLLCGIISNIHASPFSHLQTTITTRLSSGNNTSSHHLLTSMITPRNIPSSSLKSCTTKPGTAIGKPNICNCYTKGAGADVSYMIQAINDTCAVIAQNKYGASKSPEVLHSQTFTLYGLPTDQGQSGRLLIKYEFAGDDKCPLGHTMNFDTCYSAFYDIAVNPDLACYYISSSNAKGGWGFDSCYAYTVDPNPQINNAKVGTKL